MRTIKKKVLEPVANKHIHLFPLHAFSAFIHKIYFLFGYMDAQMYLLVIIGYYGEKIIKYTTWPT